MAVHSRKRDFDSDKRRGGEKESLCTSRPPTLGSQALLPRGRRVVEADDRPAARFPSYQFHDLIPLLGDRFHVVAPDYPGLGFSEAPPTDCPAIDILNLAVEAHGGLKRWSVLGAAPGPSYASDYRDVDGIIFPTKRRVYAYEGDYELVKEPLLVKIDMAEITLALACCRLTAFDQARPVNVQWILLSSRLACFTTGMFASAPAHKLATFSYHNLASVFAPNCASARAIPNFASDPDQQFTTSPG